MVLMLNASKALHWQCLLATKRFLKIRDILSIPQVEMGDDDVPNQVPAFHVDTHYPPQGWKKS